MKPIILVIEDDLPLCWLIDRILSHDFDVTIKRESVSAMEWLTEGNIPDLILCDFVLPKINGLDFLRNLRKSGAFKNVPVIICTCHLDEELKERCLDAGANAFLMKPFDPTDLVETISSVIETKTLTSDEG